MNTYAVTFESNIGMFCHYYAIKQFIAASEQEARELAEAWAATMPDRDCVAVDRIKVLA
jgi:hypothetical protein